ncbi:Phosphopantetheine adenylyltransferase [subsurface metagenome]
MTIAICPGSFDPITNGHLEVIQRAAKLFDKLIVGVYATPHKYLTFTVEERVDLIRKATSNIPNVEVQYFTGLTVEFARQVGAQVMVRGLRMTLDFEREFDMAMMNKKLYPGLELVCFMAAQQYQFLSSSLLKEVAGLDGAIDDLVPSCVAEALRKKAMGE